MVLGSTRPLTEMSTRNISWGVKVADAQGLQPYRLHVPIVSKSGTVNLVESPGLLKVLLYVFTFLLEDGSTEHSEGNKTVPRKVATTCTEDGYK